MLCVKVSRFSVDCLLGVGNYIQHGCNYYTWNGRGPTLNQAKLPSAAAPLGQQTTSQFLTNFTMSIGSPLNTAHTQILLPALW